MHTVFGCSVHLRRPVSARPQWPRRTCPLARARPRIAREHPDHRAPTVWLAELHRMHRPTRRPGRETRRSWPRYQPCADALRALVDTSRRRDPDHRAIATEPPYEKMCRLLPRPLHLATGIRPTRSHSSTLIIAHGRHYMDRGRRVGRIWWLKRPISGHSSRSSSITPRTNDNCAKRQCLVRLFQRSKAQHCPRPFHGASQKTETMPNRLYGSPLRPSFVAESFQHRHREVRNVDGAKPFDERPRSSPLPGERRPPVLRQQFGDCDVFGFFECTGLDTRFNAFGPLARMRWGNRRSCGVPCVRSFGLEPENACRVCRLSPRNLSTSAAGMQRKA